MVVARAGGGRNSKGAWTCPFRAPTVGLGRAASAPTRRPPAAFLRRRRFAASPPRSASTRSHGPKLLWLVRRTFKEMNNLANIFSVLHLDAEDDREQLTTAMSSKEEISTPKLGKDKQKGKLIGKENPVIDYDHGNLASSSSDYKMPLVWVDLEMTGLDVTKDRILEIACVITDGKLTKSIEGPDLVIGQSKECLDSMGEWCKSHHAASGLTERVLKSKISEHEAEKQVLDFVKKHIGSATPLIAGNSIYVDLLFLKMYMPNLAAIFSHVIVDVSSIMALCIRWFPKEKRHAPPKENKHRAMDDIRESIKELKYYKESIFKSQRSKQ